MPIHTQTMVVAVSAALAMTACKNQEKEADAGVVDTDAGEPTPAPEAEEPEAEEPEAEEPEPDPEQEAHIARAKEIWTEVAPGYETWPAASEQPTKASDPHGAFVHAYYNDTVKGALGEEGDWPEGSIIVKENFAADEGGTKPGKLSSVTLMKKITKDEWFWAKLEGELDKTPKEGELPEVSVAGGEDVPCAGCHASKQWRDHVITKLGEP